MIARRVIIVIIALIRVIIAIIVITVVVVIIEIISIVVITVIMLIIVAIVIIVVIVIIVITARIISCFPGSERFSSLHDQQGGENHQQVRESDVPHLIINPAYVPKC